VVSDSSLNYAEAMSIDQRLLLTIKLDGPLVDQHRLPLSEFARVTKQFRAALQDVATVLSGHGPSGQSGRVRKFIEQASDLYVVASPRPGSFVLELEVPSQLSEQEDLSLEMGPSLAERSVQSLVSGLGMLSDETEALPSGFDRGVLRAITPFRTSIAKGITDITFTTLHGSNGACEVRLDAERIDIAERLIKKPVRAQASAEGTLQMVDFKALECRIDRPPRPGVTCVFDEKDRDTVQNAIRQFVHVEGQGQFEPDQIEPSKIWVSSIKILYEELPFDPQVFWKKPQIEKLAADPSVLPFRLPSHLDDPWRDDDEAALLIAAIEDED
jgi:hypothetical protein